MIYSFYIYIHMYILYMYLHDTLYIYNIVYDILYVMLYDNILYIHWNLRLRAEMNPHQICWPIIWIHIPNLRSASRKDTEGGTWSGTRLGNREGAGDIPKAVSFHVQSQTGWTVRVPCKSKTLMPDKRHLIEMRIDFCFLYCLWVFCSVGDSV